ncbi:MAG TPA: hypothetical protein VFB82_25135 [Blastocatellia bacterium]|jgi:hypothetical protein|nr:hypothetical protein [Blastocatellia bacterium]
MPDDVLYGFFGNQWMVFLLTAAVMLAVAEVGYRIGLRLYAAKDEGRKRQIGGIQAAVLGLLGLLLGFTFAMALQRYDMRRGLVIQEASAIGTTYRRASLLPAAHQAPVQDLLRQYVDARLKYWPLVDDPSMLAEGKRLIAGMQTELWKHATEAANEAPNDITGLFISSLNETIETDAKRMAATRAIIPAAVWLLVIVVAGFGCMTTSYGAGADGTRTKLAGVLLPLLITVVILLIFDIVHPQIGLIRIGQQALVDLQQSMQPH